MKVGVYTGSILKGAKPAKSCVYVLLQCKLTQRGPLRVKTGKAQNNPAGICRHQSTFAR
jgi:hypothetical protein